MRVLAATIGSAGDFRPVLALAARLAARGHEVELAANGHFEDEVRRAGLAFFPLGTREDYLESVADPDLFHPRRGFEAVARRGILPALRPLYEWIEARADADTVVAATSLCLGARIAREKLRVPLATIHLQPTLFRSVADPPTLPGLALPRWMPAIGLRAIWRLADRMIDRVIAPDVNVFRAELGLPPVHRLFDEWLHSPDRVLALYPEWFAPPPPDGPPAVANVGFVAPADEELELPPPLARFLDRGDAPLVFTPGSGMARGERFFAAAIDAAERLDRRAVLLTGHPEQLPKRLPKTALHLRWAPLRTLLPRAAAFVHHGGIGSSAEGFAAGIPQVVMPMSHDQPDNARRIERLGVGVGIPPKRFTGRRLAAALASLLADGEGARRAREIAARIDFAAAVDRAADLVGALAPGADPLGRPLRFIATDDAEFPYVARDGAREWTVRVNDWPEDPTVYTLLSGGREVLDFDDWPEAWERPAGGEE